MITTDSRKPENCCPHRIWVMHILSKDTKEEASKKEGEEREIHGHGLDPVIVSLFIHSGRDVIHFLLNQLTNFGDGTGWFFVIRQVLTARCCRRFPNSRLVILKSSFL